MLIGRKSRAAEEMDTALADYPVLNLKKKKKSLRSRSEGRAVVAHGYLRQVFGNGQYLADIPMELRWEPNRLTLLLDLCPCDFIRSMSLPRSVLSMSARLAYNLKARRSQILEGTRDNGYLRRGYVLEAIARTDHKQSGHALGELLDEIIVRRRAELDDFCALTRG